MPRKPLSLPRRIALLSSLFLRASLLRPAPWILLALLLATLPLFDTFTAFSFDRAPIARRQIVITTLFLAPALFLLAASLPLNLRDQTTAALPLLARPPAPLDLVLATYAAFLAAALLALAITTAAGILILHLPPFFPAAAPASHPRTPPLPPPRALLLPAAASFLHLAVHAGYILLASALFSRVHAAVVAISLYIMAHLAPALPILAYVPLPNFAFVRPFLDSAPPLPPPQVPQAIPFLPPFLYAATASLLLVTAATLAFAPARAPQRERTPPVHVSGVIRIKAGRSSRRRRAP